MQIPSRTSVGRSNRTVISANYLYDKTRRQYQHIVLTYTDKGPIQCQRQCSCYTLCPKKWTVKSSQAISSFLLLQIYLNFQQNSSNISHYTSGMLLRYIELLNFIFFANYTVSGKNQPPNSKFKFVANLEKNANKNSSIFALIHLNPAYLLTYVLEIVFCNLLQIFTTLHGMQTRSSDENSVRPSVCPSVRLSATHVDCDKTVKRSVQTYIPYERTFSLVF